MAYDIATTEPTELTAGDTVQWTRSLPSFPAAAGWVLTYTLINSSGKISITASASGSDHAVSVPAATSGAWAAGKYQWQAYATLGTERHLVGTGTVLIKPNFSVATTYDGRSHARKVLEAIEAALESRATNDQLDILTTSFGDRSVGRDKSRLLELRDRYRREVRAEEDAERAAQGLPTRNKILVRL